LNIYNQKTEGDETVEDERKISITVILLRRDPQNLTREEKTAIENSFPGEKIQYLRTDPRDYLEHDAQCARFNRPVVMLPLERPIPSLAMEHGVPHIAIVNGQLMELKPLVPEFRPFQPDE